LKTKKKRTTHRAAPKIESVDARFSKIFDGTPVAMLLVDYEGQIALANREAHSLFGYPADTLINRPVESLVPRRIRRRHARMREEFQSNASVRSMASGSPLNGVRRDGKEIPLEVGLNPIRHGRSSYTLVSLLDLSERRRAEEALAESEREIRLIMDHAPFMVAYVDQRRRYRFVNRRFEQAFVLDGDRILGKSIREFLGRKVYTRVKSHWDRAFRNNFVSYEFRLRFPHGSSRWVHVDLIPRDRPDGKVIGMFVIVTDIHERKLAENALSQLPHRILVAQEDERKRVARELHDGVNQLLGSIRFRMRSAVKSATEAACPVNAEFSKIEGLLEKSIEEVRRVSRALLPPELEELGLGPALKNLCLEFKRERDLPVELEIPENPDLSPDTALHLFRICQESLSNAARHAKASSARVRLAVKNERVVLEIRDNGRGLANRSELGSGLGLNNIRHRAAGLGGSVSLDSSPGGGTRVRVSIPVEPARGARDSD
jgi:PAS domain S-box-containing protein